VQGGKLFILRKLRKLKVSALAGYHADIKIDNEKTKKKRHLPRAECPGSWNFSGRTACFCGKN